MNTADFQSLLAFHRAPTQWAADSIGKDYDTVWRTSENGCFLMRLLGWSDFNAPTSVDKRAFVQIAIALASLAPDPDRNSPGIEVAKKWLNGEATGDECFVVQRECERACAYAGAEAASAAWQPTSWRAYQSASSILNVNDWKGHGLQKQADAIRQVVGDTPPPITHPHVQGDIAALQALAKWAALQTVPAVKLTATQDVVATAQRMAQYITDYLLREAAALKAQPVITTR